MTDTYSKKVRYLGSTGTQYIDMGLKGKENLDIEIGVKFNSVSGTQYLLGNISTGGALAFQLNDDTFSYFYGEDVVEAVQTVQAETDYVIKAHLYSGNQYVDINGTSSTPTTESGTFETTQNLRLFGVALFGSVFGISCEMSYCKIWDNGTLVRDYEPVLDNNNTPAMFDNVSQTLYYNGGTGDFTYAEFPEPKTNKKLMRKKLALMLANLRQRRKYYCEVEYLESTGTQWINSNIKSSIDTKVELKYARTKDVVQDVIVGNKVNDSNDFRFFNTYSGTTTYFIFDMGAQRTYTTLATSSVLNTLMDITVDKNGMSVNGTLYSINVSSVSSVDIGLFGGLSANSGYYYSDGIRIYACKIYDSGFLVRDLIPVLDWSYVPCMYDKVSGQLFYNQGTGTFTYGREIHYVDYLESTGTQYIDTGYSFNSSTDTIEISYQNTATAQHKWLFGSYETNANIGISSATITAPTFWYKGSVSSTESAQYNSKHTLTYNSSGMFNDGLNLKAFTSYVGTWNLYLFALNNTGTSPNGYFGYGKIWGYKQTRNGNLIVDYQPAIDENGVGFMFDAVTHSIFDNAGTGAFKYPARETEYIEVTDVGTNNQNPCLDLGLKYKPSMSIESKYTRTAQGVSGSVLPLSNSTTQPLIYMPALNAGAKTDRFVWRRPSLPESSYYYDFADYPMTVEFKVDAVNDVLYVNGVSAKTGMIAAMNGYTSPYESDSNLYMLSINGTYGGMGKVYYLKLYDTTQVYRDLVPVWKDGVAGMYDKENSVFYSNTKTGTVTCGKIVESEWE